MKTFTLLLLGCFVGFVVGSSVSSAEQPQLIFSEIITPTKPFTMIVKTIVPIPNSDVKAVIWKKAPDEISSLPRGIAYDGILVHKDGHEKPGQSLYIAAREVCAIQIAR